MKTITTQYLCLPSLYLILPILLLFSARLSASTSVELDLGKKNSTISIVSPESTQQDPAQLKGRILDKSGEPMVGATVFNKNSKLGVTTDLDGNYHIAAEPGDILLFRFIGMQTVEVAVRQGQSTIDVVMDADENILEDVIVTGYQTISKERAPGSYSILTSKSLENQTGTGLISRIEGLVPGMSKNGESKSSYATIRGISTVEGNTSILYVIDGMISENATNSIHPNDITNITVLKDAAATSIYGARAANGVIVITTRKGHDGKTKVNYNGNIHFSEVSSLNHLNLTSSSEMVNYYQEVFNNNSAVRNHYVTEAKKVSYYMDPVLSALVSHSNGNINNDLFNTTLAHYSSQDNRKQIYDAFSRTAVTHQHNLNISGGSSIYKFYISANYLEEKDHDEYSSSKKYGFSAKNDFNISRKLKAFFNLSTTISSSSVSNYKTASYSGLLQSYPSYYMLEDENGNLLTFPNGRDAAHWKSETEINRLIGLGLKDEHYYPTLDVRSNMYGTKSSHTRVQAGLSWDIIDGLSANISYQTEISNSKTKTHYLEDSYFMRNHINDATQIKNGVITYNVPLGGRLNDNRSDSRSYLLRGQLDYTKTFNKDHTVTALFGSERRAIRSTSSYNVLLGYDENGMKNVTYNPFAISSKISGTQSMDQTYIDSSVYARAEDNEPRYISFYGNASYNYKRRYDISSSIRVDESNLFGRLTNNKWQPIWSVGSAWHIKEEAFMKNANWINRLTLRLTYGIGGNTSDKGSRFLTVRAVSGTDYYTKQPTIAISGAPNENLKWEETATTNIGLDFSFIKSRIRASIDYYQKRGTDLLGDKVTDPTLGFTKAKINYGEMDNKGIEATLSSTNIRTKDFQWNTGITFSYNKNKLRNFEGTVQNKTQYLYPGALAIDKPLESIFSARYAGLDEKGTPMFYNKENEKVAYDKIEIEDLVHSGTSIPKYTAALMNSFSYKNFEFSFKIMYYGGHIMRDQSQAILSGKETFNFNRKSLNYWKQSGDELNLDGSSNLSISPGLAFNTPTWELGWLSRDTNVEKADYIKLRNVNLTYRVPKSFLNKINIEQLTLTFQADNLAWWAPNGDIDPAFQYYTLQGRYSTAPRTKPNYSFGININF